MVSTFFLRSNLRNFKKPKNTVMHENIIVKHKINASVEKVWNALTDRSQLKDWYFDIPDFEPKVHAEFNFYEPGGENKYHHRCEIVEIIPLKKLKHSWAYPEFSKDKTMVKWELSKDGDGTIVTLTHKGLENFEHLGNDFQRESFKNGWEAIIGQSLKNYLEN